MKNLVPPIEVCNKENESKIDYILNDSIGFKSDDDFDQVRV